MATERGLPPGYRFVPTDEEVVELCLLPRIQDQPLLPHDIIDDDPLSAPPWALLEKHGRRHQAFFFAACQAMNAKGSRQKRTCAGHGTWQGQGKRKRKDEQGQDQEANKKKLRVHVRGGAEKMEVEWDKYALNFHEAGDKGSTGWVMHEYSITAPPKLARSPVRVYCVRFSGHGRNAKKRSRDAQHRCSDDDFEDDEEDEVGDAAGAIADTAICSAAAEEDPALFIDEYPPPPAPQLDSFSAMMADAVNPNPADGADAGAGYDQNLDLPAFVDDAGGAMATATWSAADEDAALALPIEDWSAADEDAALLIEEYLTSFPLEAVDVVSFNTADVAGAGAGNVQNLPALVGDGSFDFMMNSLPDLLPTFDLSQ